MQALDSLEETADDVSNRSQKENRQESQENILRKGNKNNTRICARQGNCRRRKNSWIQLHKFFTLFCRTSACMTDTLGASNAFYLVLKVLNTTRALNLKWIQLALHSCDKSVLLILVSVLYYCYFSKRKEKRRKEIWDTSSDEDKFARKKKKIDREIS